jgi:PST family polysaccharide transporter
MTWGVFARLIAWPLGYWMMARRSPRAFMLVEGVACILSMSLPVIFMDRMGLVGTAVGFFWAAILYAILLVCLLYRGSGILPGAGTTKAVIIAAMAVYACKWLSALSNHHYLALLSTMLAAIGSFWCYRCIIIKENEERAE